MQKTNIILEENGRIFPNWVMQNFKKYILPDIIRQEGEDPCNEAIANEVTKYQKLIGSYLDYRSPFRSILAYHGVGSGKTVTAINVYNILYNYTPRWNVFLIIPASLKDDPWLKDIKVWLQKENYEARFNNLVFVHYDSPFADRDFLDKIKKADNSKPFLFIIEECHRFINNVYNNISSKKGKRAQIIYDYIQQEMNENKNNRLMMLSATPAVNQPFELALIFNLLRPGSFPTSEALFSQLYISSSNFASLNEDNKNMFQRRILGLVSYYIGATPDKYAQKIVHYKNIVMNDYFEEKYNYFEKIEEEKEKISRRMSRGKVGGDEMSTYSSYTRQASNFIFPPINEFVDGEQRPRPSKFKIKEVDSNIIDEGKNNNKKVALIKSSKEIAEYVKAINNYINTLINYLKDIHRQDKNDKHTLQDDIKQFKDKYNSSFTDFHENAKKSNLYETLYMCSPKFIHIIFNILKSKGPVLIYSNYVEMEGLQIIKIYLQFFGFISLDKDQNMSSQNDNFRYVEYHGSIEREQRELNKKTFNNPENKYGKLVKIIMISPAGAEGINLYNVRQVHITEPYWNEVRIEQVIGRAIRQCHHAALPIEERKVDVFRYKMVRKNGKETTDERLESISRKKNNLLISFIEAVKEAAIDCELFKAHNMMGTKYKCFQFNEDSILGNNIGPAYLSKLEYDQKINNGSNSKDSITLKIKTRKINAIFKIDDNFFSNSKIYWYYDKNNVLYDYDLKFPVGRLTLDDSGNPIKIDNQTYLIDKLVDIPEFKIYD